MSISSEFQPLEWRDDFVVLDAQLSVADARQRLAASDMEVVLVWRESYLQYVFLRNEIVSRLAGADATLDLARALDLHEDDRSLELERDEPAAAMPAVRPDASTAGRFYVQDTVAGRARLCGIPVAAVHAYAERSAAEHLAHERTVRSTTTRRTRGEKVEPAAARADGGHPPARAEVSTGFATPDRPDRGVAATVPLAPDRPYVFWFTIGPRSDSIEIAPTAPPVVPVGTRLRVILFPFPDGFEVPDEQSEGVIEVTDASGVARVLKQPDPALAERIEARDIRDSTLLFPVRTPKASGLAALRCGIYYGQTLLQSRFVRAAIGTPPTSGRTALESTVDYTISHTFDPERLRQIPDYALSIMANESCGTHSFFVVGTNFKGPVHVEPKVIETMLKQGRGALRKTAWGTDKPYARADDSDYRYRKPRRREDLFRDLIELARVGLPLYVDLSVQFAQGRLNVKALADVMRTPQFVQCALKESPDGALPIALLYDKPLHLRAPEEYSVCPAFATALDTSAALEDSACFKGECPSWDDQLVMCPSGFWGYRQKLGMPVDILYAPDAPAVLQYAGTPVISGGVWARFRRVDAHLAELGRRTTLDWNLARRQDRVIQSLRDSQPQLVYFYCHGGVDPRGKAFVKVGDDALDKPLREITGVELFTQNVLWVNSRPLVFINGCETTAVEPGQLLSLVASFVRDAYAGGVVGTEITVFESIATRFAEECLTRFLSGLDIGDAVRLARLQLLREGNPLGLAYSAFSLPSLRLVAA